MAKLKVYYEYATFLGTDGLHDLLGDPSHVLQVDLYTVERSKADAAEYLVGLGMVDHVAARHVRESRLTTSPWSNVFAGAVAHGVIDVSEPGAYVFSMYHGDGIVRLTESGPVLVGTITNRRFGNYVIEPVR